MFDITLLAMGKLKEPFYLSAAAEYAKRLGGYCKFTLLELPEVRCRKIQRLRKLPPVWKKKRTPSWQKFPRVPGSACSLPRGGLFPARALRTH